MLLRECFRGPNPANRAKLVTDNYLNRGTTFVQNARPRDVKQNSSLEQVSRGSVRVRYSVY